MWWNVCSTFEVKGSLECLSHILQFWLNDVPKIVDKVEQCDCYGGIATVLNK